MNIAIVDDKGKAKSNLKSTWIKNYEGWVKNDLLILVDGWQFPPIGDVEYFSHLPSYNESFIPFLNWALQFEFSKGTTVVHHDSARQAHQSFKWIDRIDVYRPYEDQTESNIFDFNHIFLCGFHLQSCVTLMADVIRKKLSEKYTKEQVREKLGIVLNLSLPWLDSIHTQTNPKINRNNFNYYMWRSTTKYTSFSLHQ